MLTEVVFVRHARSVSHLSTPQPIGPTTLLAGVFMRRNRSFTPIVLTYGGAIENDVIGEIPSGAINGSNVNFITIHNYRSDTLAVYLNGLRQHPTLDFLVTGSNMFQLTTPPVTGDTIVIDYLKT